MSLSDGMGLLGLTLIAAGLWAWWGWPAAAVWAGVWLLLAAGVEASTRQRRGT